MNRRTLSLICAALAGAVTLLLAATQDPVVTVTGGQVKGRALTTGAVFKGLPFAAPPVGDLRWKEPMPVKSWTGVRDAGDFGATCAQIDAGWNKMAAEKGKEDCLFLNVWAPEWPPKSRKPVMFWIHGGGNMGGSAVGAGGIEPPFDGERMAAHGVVVVTINYRLGLFGFFAHPELTAESPHHASGNYGLLDQIAALRWVQENIARFGGDPHDVTVFGQSAGGQDTGLLLASPLAKGLIHRAIEESGTVTIGGDVTAPRSKLEQAGVQLAATWKAPATGQIQYLRGLSTAEILKASPPYAQRGPLRPEPDIDGYAIVKVPAQVFKDHQELPVPLIVGNNGRERTLAGGPEALKKAIEAFYGNQASQAFKLYGLDGPNPDSYPPHGDGNSQWETDNMFRCGSVVIANWHSARFPTWEYEFTRASEPQGAVHSWELQFVFGNLRPEASQPADRKLSDQVLEYWTNFARTGNPNGGSLPDWPKHDPKAAAYIDFSADGPTALEGLRQGACAMFEQRLPLSK
jgi:para-nitrobenzyl esterase